MFLVNWLTGWLALWLTRRRRTRQFVITKPHSNVIDFRDVRQSRRQDVS